MGGADSYESPEPVKPSAERRSIPLYPRVPEGLSAAGAQMLERVRARRYQAGISLALFLGVNFILLGLYVWSRGGETVHIQVVARGNEFTASIDGGETTVAHFDAPEQGGLLLVLGRTDALPSLPGPSGIDSITITDLANGAVLFEDHFTNGPSADWNVATQDYIVKDGVLGARSDVELSLGERPWRDYVVDMTFKNPVAGALRLRATSDDSSVDFTFRPLRHYDGGFTVRRQGENGEHVAGKPIEIDRVESVKSLLAMVLRPYPYTFAFLAVALLVVAVLHLVTRPACPARELPSSLRDVSWFAAAGLASFGLVVTAFINYSYNDHMPHVPDELAYLFQAHLFANFHLSAPVPPVAEVFDYIYPTDLVVQNGHWISVYPFGHPLMLAIGENIGAVWLVPAAIGAATVLLIFAIGRKVYSARVGLLAALIFVTSPFFLMTASNFMSHNTAAFYLTASLFCVVISDRRPFVYGVLGGLLYGLFFNTQQLAAVALIAPVGVLLVGYAIPKDRRGKAAQHTAGFLLGGLLMLGAYFLYNVGTTGDAFTNGLQIGSNPAQFVGFGGENSVSHGIQNQQIQLAFLLLVLNGWPLYAGLMFVLMPFVLATRHRWDWFLLIAAIVALAVYVLYIGSGIMHGPRYWYVASPLLALLTARGADRAAEVLSSIANELSSQWARPGEAASRWPGVVVTYAAVLGLVGAGIYGWLLGRHITWSDELVPNHAAALRGFNKVDDRLVRLVDEEHLHNALVLVPDCDGWQCYGSVFWLNDPQLNGDVVYARDIPARHGELFAAYPDRYVYAATYSPLASLSPFGTSSPVLEANGTPNAPLARDIPVPTATPSPGPAATADIPNREERDQQRIP